MNQRPASPRARFGPLASASAAPLLMLAACGGASEQAAQGNAQVAEDPYGATGAPGADMTDKGVTDGAAGPADDTAPNTTAPDGSANGSAPAGR